jgi:diguanylate cyclase (GGDEF)-like protein
MMSDAVKLSTVERLIASRRPFPRPIREQFERDSRDRHTRRLRAVIVPAIIIYNLLLAADFFLVPDVWQVSAAIHLVIVTPFMIGVALLLPRLRSRTLREFAAACLPLVMSLQVLFVFAATTSRFADHYQYLVLLNMVFLSTSLRPKFSIVLSISALVLCLHFVAVQFLSDLRWQEAGMASLVLTVVIYMTGIGSLSAERRERRAYLFRLRESLRHAQADLSSRHDELTGFLNRSGLEKALHDLWNAPFSQVAAIMVDIDHFKSYNDHYGHLAGDSCLKEMAALIAAETRQPQDVLARFGGEEFLVLLPNTDLREGSRIAERMRRALQRAAMPHESPEASSFVSASFGVGSAATKTMSARELISAADAALYHVKKNGRNGVWPAVDRPVLSVVGPGAGDSERRSHDTVRLYSPAPIR